MTIEKEIRVGNYVVSVDELPEPYRSAHDLLEAAMMMFDPTIDGQVVEDALAAAIAKAEVQA